MDGSEEGGQEFLYVTQGFVRGAMICLGPDNPVALICGGIGAAIMGGLAHWSYSKIMGWF